MKALLLILLLVAGCSQAPKPQTSATWQQDDETAWAWREANENAKAELGYLDSNYLAERDSLLEARHD